MSSVPLLPVPILSHEAPTILRLVHFKTLHSIVFCCVVFLPVSTALEILSPGLSFPVDFSSPNFIGFVSGLFRPLLPILYEVSSI